MSSQFIRIWNVLSARHKSQLLWILVLSVGAALAEAFTISAVIPFISILVAPEILLSNPIIKLIFDRSTIVDLRVLLLPITITFVIAICLSGLARIALSWAQISVSRSIGAELSCRIYESTLYEDFEYHVNSKSSEIIAGLSKASSIVANLIYPTMAVLSGSFSLIGVVLTLTYFTNQYVVYGGLLIFSCIYMGIFKVSKRIQIRVSKTIATNQGSIIRIVQEGLGGVRHIIIDGSQRLHIRKYRDAVVPYQEALAANQMLATVPRYLIEITAFASIAVIAYVGAVRDGPEKNFLTLAPLLGAFALSAIRILPVIQQIYGALITIRGNRGNIEDVISFVKRITKTDLRESTDSDKLIFLEKIELRDISFKFLERDLMVLDHVNLRIRKGSKVGIVGESGSGKSTLLDIIMGLLKPTSGELIIDDENLCFSFANQWHSNIGHVPQTIFLADASVVENVALGVVSSDVNMARVENACRLANIDDLVRSMPDGYNTNVGEKGIKLSGGQRQRLGIARALYRNAAVLVLDEPTSALDRDTEIEVLRTIYSLDKEVTVIIVSHRVEALGECDELFTIENGKVIRLR